MHLTKEQMKTLIVNSNLIENYFDIDSQLTANGVDVRLAAVVEVIDGGKLAVNKSDNRSPKLGKAFVLKDFEDRLEGYNIAEKHILDSGTVKLNQLRPYLVITCEKVNTPNDLMFHIKPRSSLFRFTQSLLGTAFGEAGYKGFLTFLLLSPVESEIELGARFAQLSFAKLEGKSDYESQKETNYQGGKLF